MWNIKSIKKSSNCLLDFYLLFYKFSVFKTEYEILLLLLRHAGQALTHNQILRQVWGEVYQDRPEYVRVHMAQLRQKIEQHPAQPQFLKTEAGVGYRLCLNWTELRRLKAQYVASPVPPDPSQLLTSSGRYGQHRRQ